MSSLLLILLSAVLIHIVVLTSVPEWRPFEGLYDVFDASKALAVASLIALPAVTLITWLLTQLLLEPLALGYLRTPVFVAVILAIAPLVEIAARRLTGLTPVRSAFLLLLTTHTAVLGVALISDARAHTIVDAVLFAFGAALAFGFLLLAFAALYERLRYADVPSVFRDAPLALVTIGIMALSFMGFSGLVQE